MEKVHQTFYQHILSGDLRDAVRFLIERNGGCMLDPDKKCTEIGKLVLQVLLKIPQH